MQCNVPIFFLIFEFSHQNIFGGVNRVFQKKVCRKLILNWILISLISDFNIKSFEFSQHFFFLLDFPTRTSLKLRLKPRTRVYMTIAIRPLSTPPTSPIFWISYYNWNFDLNPLPKPESSTQIWNLYPNLKPLPKPESLINT